MINQRNLDKLKKVLSSWYPDKPNIKSKVNTDMWVDGKKNIEHFFNKVGTRYSVNPVRKESARRGQDVVDIIDEENDEMTKLPYIDFKLQMINYANIKSGITPRDIKMSDVEAHISKYIFTNPKYGN